ncbi:MULTISPECIES: sensor histidine kinase [unclassified Methylophaga]|uniref:sensor histidine kinase n=1 Tax=unclassified Methylophaga TaxID=2629249 RepID=UPI000C98F2FB|nr:MULTISPECIES: sensor histidine kinase [unclassified Methylophaga]MAK68085.1 hypothetical protein [Methylophaga sp.]MAY16860.1 hypothetical protein [Methylophaga sp.]HCD04530.1 hypothetical protein [Methylophaga sp.]
MNLILQVNLIILVVFIVMCGLGVNSTLDDIRLRVDHELDVSTEVANYAIEAQVARLELELSQHNLPLSQWHTLFHLKDLRELLHVDIELIANDGELLDSNHPDSRDEPTGLPSWFENSLKAYLGHTEIITTPIIFAEQHLGDIVISPSFSAEWNDIRTYIQKSLMPLILIFFIGSLLIAVFASLILWPISEMLAKTNKKSMQTRSPFALLRLNQLLAVNKQLKLLEQRYVDTGQKVDVLNQQLITIQESERKRLSAELHDEIGQHLTAIQFDLNAIKYSVSLDEAKTSAAAIDSVHSRMTTIVRSMLQRLRPPELTDLGLQGAVRELFNDWVIRHPHHQAKLSLEGNFSQLDETRQLTIYRIIQECMTNVSRHAGAENVHLGVHLRCNNDFIDISVSDNGNGYHPSCSNKGYGLTGMRERVEALSGSFNISTAPGKGFTVSASFPTQGVAE